MPVRHKKTLLLLILLVGLFFPTTLLLAEDDSRSFDIPGNAARVSFAPPESTHESPREPSQQLRGIKEGFSPTTASPTTASMQSDLSQPTRNIRLASHEEPSASPPSIGPDSARPDSARPDSVSDDSNTPVNNIPENPAENTAISDENTAQGDGILDQTLFSGSKSQSGNKLERPKFSQAIAPLVAAFGSLAIVVAVFFLFVLFFKKISPKGNRILPKEAFEDLGRTFLTQKNVLHLLRLGNRLILVSVTPEGVSPITEVDDPDEVVAVLGMCRRLETESATQLFRKNLEELSREDGKTGYFGVNAQEKSSLSSRPGGKQKPRVVSKSNLDLSSEPTESLAELLASGIPARGGHRE